jgi:hypothetical protein
MNDDPISSFLRGRLVALVRIFARAKAMKFVQPDSLLAEICNRIIDAIEARVLKPANVKQIVERTCAAWYANLPTGSESSGVLDLTVQPTCDCGGGLAGEPGSHALNCARSGKGS